MNDYFSVDEVAQAMKNLPDAAMAWGQRPTWVIPQLPRPMEVAVLTAEPVYSHDMRRRLEFRIERFTKRDGGITYRWVFVGHVYSGDRLD